MAGVLSEEELTEALTTMKQSGIEAGHGLRERPLSYAESAKEVWPTVALTTPLLGGGGAIAARLTQGQQQQLPEKTPSQKISDVINVGMATGEVNGQSFTPDHAINFIKQGYIKDIFSDADISQFKERYPELVEGLREDVSPVADIGKATSVNEAVASFEKATSGDEELSRVYGEARKRVGLLTPQETAEKEFEAYSGPEIPADWQVIKEGKGVEVMARPQGLLQPKTAPNIFELQERVRQRRGQIVEAEKEYEGYIGPELPSKPEVKMKEGPRTYPRGAEYVAGKPAPESLEVEHKPILTQRGQPWVTQNGAQTALKSQKRLLEKGITAKTHKVIPFKGGFAIEKKVIEIAVTKKLKEVSKKVKAETPTMLKESDKVNDVTLGTLVDIAAEDPAKALEHAAEATVSKAKLIEGLKNKGLKAMGEAKSKEERTEIKKNLEETLRGIEGGEKPLSQKVESGIKKIERLDAKRREHIEKYELIVSTSGVGQAPPVAGVALDKAIAISKKQAKIWNDIRSHIVFNGKTLWQIAVADKKTISKTVGEEEGLDFYGSDIRKMIERAKKPKSKAIKISEFKNTEDALAFGKKALPEEIGMLKALRKKSIEKSDKLQAAGDLDGAMEEATKGQFFREAIEVAEGKVVEVKKPKEPVVETEKLFPKIKDNVIDGRTVSKDVPNTDSIQATLTDYEELPGIREISLDEIETTDPRELFYAADDIRHVKKLADEIKKSNKISPLIVVQDTEGLYILEGAHRLGALHTIGAKSFPALVVRDLESLEKVEVAPKPEREPTWTAETEKAFNVLRKKDKAKKEKPVLREPEEEGAPTDIEGNELVDMDDVPMEVNPDGTVTLYHRTTPEKAENLRKTGKFRSLENTKETFFSNKFDGQAVGYGDAIITVKVAPSKTRLDDAFHDGEITVAVSNKILSKTNIVVESLSETKSRLLANIKSEKGSSELINDLARLGADAIKRGHKSFKAFSAEMKVVLGDAWAKVKHLMQEAYSAAKVVLKNERGAIDIRGPKAEFEDLGVWADDLITKTLGEKPTATKKERLFVHDTSSEPITEDDYVANRKDSKDIKLVARTGARRVISEIAEGVDKFLGSISTRLGQVSPKLKTKIRRLDFDINTKHAADVGKIHPLLLKAKKMKSSDYADWDYARKNSDVEKIQELVEKYDMQKEYAVYRQTLDNLRAEGIDVGLAIGKIDEYAPRYLKDSKGFLTAIGRADEWPVYSRRLQERANELGISIAEMTSDMKAETISNMILGGWSGLGGIPATKQRKLKKIPAYLNKYYMDSDAALMQHLYSMRKGVEARKFFGKIPKKVTEIRKRLHAVQAKYREISKHMREELPEKELEKLRKQRNKYIGLERQYSVYIAKYALQRDYTENIGSYVMELIDNKEISPQHERVVNDILNARFHEAGTRGLIQAYKNLSYIDTMGSPISALTQIGDLAWALYEGGFIGTTKHALRALVGKSRITKEDVGITRIAQEFADSGKLGKAVTRVFKVVGLEKIDSIGKESLLNVAFEKYQKQAKDDSATLKRKISPIFENETDSVIEDLLNDEISENVKLLVHSRLLDFQPVALSETPQRYLDAGNGRLFYMLKTFTIKVFDVYRNEAYYKIKNGLKVGDNAEVKKGLKNLARLSMFFVLCNAGADELKDWVLGRKTDFSDRMIDNVLRLFGVSKFVTWKARTEGVGSALARQILPPFKFIDSAGKDIITAGDERGLEVIGSIPVIGKLAYWHMGRGVSKREDLWNRRLRKHKSKLNEIKEGFEKAKDKDAFRRKHWEELTELKATNELQGKLNKRRKKINELKSKKELPARKKLIQGLEKERTELIRDFLQRKGKRSVYADSIWAGVLGTTKEMDTIQSEVKRLVDTGLLTSSMKPARKDIIGRMKKKIELTDEQYSQLVSDTEKAERKRLERFVGREGWEDMTDERKVSIIKRSIAKARAKARKDLRREIMRINP
ncbi:MAG: ParB N-terminal domain-containing protein [Desulfobacteraceae bacterium]|nr:ParB N-terminal domain-containing protein [Desulfobacteraceae bacterium]